jgi:hypothetical protein
MKDFTLQSYLLYLKSIKSNFQYFLTFQDYLSSESKPENFCLLRHDVDRNPNAALEMSLLENKIGIRSTYYFRTKYIAFSEKIIKKISSMGHEIGYHYESLGDCNGDYELAYHDFVYNLNRLRSIVDITTISMHSQPLSRHDNRDLWRNKKYHKKLINELNILGEVYLDIDYSDISYITDAGRNWVVGENNLRDYVESNLSQSFHTSMDLLKYLATTDDKLIFSTHPERWPSSYRDYVISNFRDYIFNLGKKGLKKLHQIE